MQELEQLQPEVPKKEALVTKCEKLVGDRQNRIDEIKDRIFADFSKEVPFDPPHFSKEVPFDPPPLSGEHMQASWLHIFSCVLLAVV